MSAYDWQPYAIGGATRADSFSGMTPEMQQALYAFLQAADQDLGPGLQVYSGYRSPELQGRLFRDAVAKYGSEAAARKWVAPPGRSKHNSGLAADMKWNGVRIDQVKDPKVRAWIRENAGTHNLHLPMSWEPWQVELAGSRGGASAGLGHVSPRTTSAQAGLPWEVRAGIGQARQEDTPPVPLWEMMQRNDEGQFGETPEGMLRIPGTGLALSQAGLGNALMALGGSFGA